MDGQGSFEFNVSEFGPLVPTPHHEGFNRAFERALRGRDDLEDGATYEVRLRVRVKQVPNPGYVVDSYIVDLT